jgi:hypothetical protein
MLPRFFRTGDFYRGHARTLDIQPSYSQKFLFAYRHNVGRFGSQYAAYASMSLRRVSSASLRR